MRELKAELRADMAALRDELRGEMAVLRAEFRDEMRNLEIRVLQAMSRQLAWFAGIVIGQRVATVALIGLVP